MSYDADAIVAAWRRRRPADALERLPPDGRRVFGYVDGVLTGARRAGGQSGRSPGPNLASSPLRPARRRRSQRDFLAGVAVGAALVAFGVLIGGAVTISVAWTARGQAEPYAGATLARELLELHLARIAERNPQLNAIVSLDEDRARAGAAAADEHLAQAARSGRCTACRSRSKDTHAVAGGDDVRLAALRRPRPRGRRPDRRRIRRAGAVCRQDERAGVRGGSHTFNSGLRHDVQPGRPEPVGRWVERRRGVRLAAGMVPLAEGSDMGGSLRNPASFCGVVGMRPRPGRVPTWPASNQWEPMSVGGPMARTVGDVALLLSVIAGPDPRVPLALGDPAEMFAAPLAGSLAGLRVGYSVDLGGAFTVDPQVATVLEGAGRLMVRSGRRSSTPTPT